MMGGSLAAAIYHSRYKYHNLIAICHNESEIAALKDSGYFSSITTDITAAQYADIIIICAPLSVYHHIFTYIDKNQFPDNIIISDIGSVKQYPLSAYHDSGLQEKYCFIPMHPIAGNEKSGFTGHDSKLFQDKIIWNCADLNIEHTINSNIKLRENYQQLLSIWRAVGGNIKSISATEHDRIYAALSHFPQKIAFALAKMVMAGIIANQDSLLAKHPEHSTIITRFFRLQKSPQSIWQGIFHYNQDNISAITAEFIKQIDYHLNNGNYHGNNSGNNDNKITAKNISQPSQLLFIYIISNIIADTADNFLSDTHYTKYIGSGFKDMISGKELFSQQTQSTLDYNTINALNSLQNLLRQDTTQ